MAFSIRTSKHISSVAAVFATFTLALIPHSALAQRPVPLSPMWSVVVPLPQPYRFQQGYARSFLDVSGYSCFFHKIIIPSNEDATPNTAFVMVFSPTGRLVASGVISIEDFLMLDIEAVNSSGVYFSVADKILNFSFSKGNLNPAANLDLPADAYPTDEFTTLAGHNGYGQRHNERLMFANSFFNADLTKIRVTRFRP